MRSGFDPASYDWTSEYYQELSQARGSTFVQHTFAPGPALVARSESGGYRQSVEYRGEPFDPAQYDLVAEAWNHDTCTVCRFRINPGHTYWESLDRVWLLCDECHAHAIGLGASSEEGPA